MIDCKSDVELDLMREAGRIVALTHQELQLDQIADDLIRKQGTVFSSNGYPVYPASICASVKLGSRPCE